MYRLGLLTLLVLPSCFITAKPSHAQSVADVFTAVGFGICLSQYSEDYCYDLYGLENPNRPQNFNSQQNLQDFEIEIPRIVVPPSISTPIYTGPGRVFSDGTSSPCSGYGTMC